MSNPEHYEPGTAFGATIEQNDDQWTLVLVRELAHAPAKVWTAITDPEHLCQWAPFDSDRNLATPGSVRLSTVGTPTPHVTETEVKRAEPPTLLEMSWGDADMRWELEPLQNGGTRLTLWHSIGRDYISMGAAGWHICFDVLDRLLIGEPIGRIVGPEAMKFGWPRLKTEYEEQFGPKQDA